MEVLKPPTDTLYKFFAISGLLFFITSLVSPIWLTQKLNNQYAELLRDREILILDAKVWEQTAKEMDTADEVFSAARSRLPQTKEEFEKWEVAPAERQRLIDEARQAGENLTTKIREFRNKVLEWRKQDAQVKFKGDLVDASKETTDRMFWLSSVGVMFGFLMSITGFTLWYRRTQRFEDLILKNKSQSDTAQLPPA